MRELEFDEEMMDTAMEWSKNYVKKFHLYMEEQLQRLQSSLTI